MQERTARRARCGPCVHFIATVADAAAFSLHCWPQPEAKPLTRPLRSPMPLLFDRVLCDVPCGGDGTLRKSPGKWRRWGVCTGLRAHATQLAILRRGLELLAPGGILVYST